MNRRGFISGAVIGATGTGVALAGGSAWARLMSEPQPRGRRSFAECGEDLVIYDLTHLVLGLRQPTYLDVGAADPVRANNTYLLYTTGSRGVLVEPNPTFAERLRRKRVGDTVVNAGIGTDSARQADYYVIRSRPELNTFSSEQAAMLTASIAGNIVERVLKMPLVSLNSVITAHFQGKGPDVLSIDVEGLDLAILRTLDFEAFRPGVICAETILGQRGTSPEIGELLVSKGYVARGGSHVNTIFVDANRVPA